MSTQSMGSERFEGAVAVEGLGAFDAAAGTASPAWDRGVASLVDAAIAQQRAVEGFLESTLVLSSPDGELSAALGRLTDSTLLVRSAASSPLGGARTLEEVFGIVVLDGVAEDVEAARPALAAAYSHLEPGGLLVLVVPAGAPRSGRSLRDVLLPQLFAEGFERPTFRSTPAGREVLRAYRSPLEPAHRRRQVLSVVMPVYNERATFREVMDRLVDKKIDGVDIEIVIVESNSSDGTRDEVLAFAEHPGVRVVLEDHPQGKGHAVRRGLAEASGDFVLIQDADLEYDLDDYDKLLEPLRTFERSFVLGARMRTDGARWGVRHFEKEVVVSRLMNVGNVVFLFLFNAVYRTRLADPFTMYKVMLRDCLNGMILECDRFDFDWELVAKLLRAGYEPLEIGVTYSSRSFSEGKKVSVLGDPLSWVRACVKYRFADFEE